MPDITSLLRVFYTDPADWGSFERMTAYDLSPDYRSLLDHDDHMTVTMEAMHESLVDVRVLESQQTDSHYARKSLLVRRSDDVVVQFCIVRLNLAFLDDPVREEIQSRRAPLGRILIRHHVMRRVELVSLWKVTPGSDMAQHLGSDRPTFGRTAYIHVGEEPAVELLEVVAPLS